MHASVTKVPDFIVNGEGTARQWSATDWQALTPVGKGHSTYATRIRFLYSATGIYFLYDCEDRRISCTQRKDFDDIFLEDVIEIFLWPNQTQNAYFEYELSPLGVELPLMILNNEGFMGWRPWKYEARPVQKATSMIGGKKEPMASVSGWRAEIFIPFKLFTGMGNSVPKKGTLWRANMYRIDYDQKTPAQRARCPATDGNFHDFRNFGSLTFQ